MTLGNVYDMDLKKNDTVIKEVIMQAQGEVRRYCRHTKIFLPTHFPSRWLSKNT
jgi:hypothetical protein